jgi:hypothetical protein
MIRIGIVLALAGWAVSAPGAGTTAPATPVGKVEYVRGVASATLAGSSRTLALGAPVFERERVATGRDAVLVLRLNDDTQFTLARNAQMDIEAFRYRPDQPDDADGLSTRILRGTFRFVSGLVAKRRPAAMKVGLSVATIGIRGTDVAGEVKEQSAVVILQGAAAAAGAITVSNAYGSVDISQAGYGTTIPTPTSAPTPPQRMRLRSIDNLQRSLQAARRAARPRP